MLKNLKGRNFTRGDKLKAKTLCFILIFLYAGIEFTLGEGNFKKIYILVGKKKIIVELADTLQKRAKGLMFRKKLAKNEGMLFLFETEDFHSFWMKNTYIPLSIAFIDKNRKIIDIQDMKPLDEKIYIPKKKTLYALEVNRGWFKKNNIKIGDKIKFLLKLK